MPVKTWYAQATRKAGYLFSGRVAQANPVICYFYRFRGMKKQRVRKNLRGKKTRCSVRVKQAKREREPGFIVSSLSTAAVTPLQIIPYYKKRRQIEAAFRDLKNTRNGFRLRHGRSVHAPRLNVALLIAAIAM